MAAVDRRLLRTSRAARAQLLLAVALGCGTAVTIVAQAALLATVIARAFLGGASPADLRGELVALLAVVALRAVLAGGFELSGRLGAERALADLRAQLVDHVLRRRPAGLERTRTGELAAAAVQGVDALEAYFARYLPQLVLAALVPPAIVVYLAARDPVAAGVLALTLPLIPLFMVLIGRSAQDRDARPLADAGLLSGHFLDVVRGLDTLRAHDRAHAQAETIAAVERPLPHRHHGHAAPGLHVGARARAAGHDGHGAGGGDGRRAARRRRARPDRGPHRAPARAGAVRAAAPARRAVPRERRRARGGRADHRRAWTRRRPWPPPRGARFAPDPAAATVRLDAVSFAYPDRPGLVLDRVSLDLAPGERVALWGRTARARARWPRCSCAWPTRPRAGSRAARWTSATSTRAPGGSWIAWVPQRPTMFAASLAENIRLGDAAATEARVLAAAEEAGVLTFARDLPDGLATRIGDGGRPLSAGQAQRVALARAFLRAAPLLILDEPTAHLDPASARALADAVERLAAGRTALLIAHDTRLALAADRVVRLAHGRIEAGDARAPVAEAVA